MTKYRDAEGVEYEQDTKGFYHPTSRPELALTEDQIGGLTKVAARKAPAKKAAPRERPAAKKAPVKKAVAKKSTRK